LAATVVVYIAVRAGALGLNQWLSSAFPLPSGGARPEVVDGKTAHLIGLILAAGVMVRLAVEAWGARPVTEAWRKGYEGEVMTAAALGRLPASYVVLHDLRLPGSRANIDHLVVGPTGVFTVETKHYSSDVVISRGRARHAGRSMDDAVRQANGQAEAVRSALGCPVRAIVCIQGASVTTAGWFTKPLVDGVRFCDGGRLVRAITNLAAEHTDEEVRDLAAQCEQRLSPAVEAPCRAIRRVS
jgi:hypothetical protein